MAMMNEISSQLNVNSIVRDPSFNAFVSPSIILLTQLTSDEADNEHQGDRLTRRKRAALAGITTSVAVAAPEVSLPASVIAPSIATCLMSTLLLQSTGKRKRRQPVNYAQEVRV